MPNYIVSANYIKKTTVVNDNVDDKLIEGAIGDVQLMYMRPLLGTRLYDQILSQIGSSTVSANNQTLLDSYIAPCMKYYVMAECAYIFQYKFWNKGILESSSENSQPVDFKTIKFLMDEYRNKAEKLATIATQYLQYNSATYTLYSTNSLPYEERPRKNSYRTGIRLDDPDDCGCNYNNP
jgi:hypothetical protein